MKSAAKKSAKRRQVPRRPYEASLGLLYRGEYLLEQTYYVSESGLMISSHRPLKEGELVVVTFKVPSSSILLVRAIVRSVVAPKDNSPERYGLEFQNLEFSAKREIRNFVAETTVHSATAI
jgi:hypothetical protein